MENGSSVAERGDREGIEGNKVFDDSEGGIERDRGKLGL